MRGFLLALVALAWSAAPAQAGCGSHATLPGEPECRACEVRCEPHAPAPPTRPLAHDTRSAQDACLGAAAGDDGLAARLLLADEPLSLPRHRAPPPVPPPRCAR
ncbi:MAG: hypothetical protein K2W96_16085 [Gemmataceae bacterium]|nr:hypothetical protein [Gemmataceae bacterium]